MDRTREKRQRERIKTEGEGRMDRQTDRQKKGRHTELGEDRARERGTNTGKEGQRVGKTGREGGE